MEFFRKIVNNFYPLTIVAKKSIKDIWWDAEQTSIQLNIKTSILTEAVTSGGFFKRDVWKNSNTEKNTYYSGIFK